MQRLSSSSKNAGQPGSSQQPSSTAAAASGQQQHSQAASGLNQVGSVSGTHALEKTIQFQQAQAIVWQLKFSLNQITSKKALNQAQNEIESLSTKFGKDFDKYLLRELIEQIDLKDPSKSQKDKTEPLKITLLIQELNRCSLKPDFLQYFGEIAQNGGFSERLGDFMIELTKRLKLNLIMQILISLSLVESCREEVQPEAIKILKQKLLDYQHGGRPEAIPEYALHRLLFLLTTHHDFTQDDQRDSIQQYLMESNPLKAGSHISMRGALQQDLMHANASVEDPSICLTKDGNGIDNLDKSFRMLEPWQLLVDLGHFASYNYNYLLKILEDFKDINEKTMARTLLNLAINHTGCDDSTSKIAQNTFEANKKADSNLLRKEIADKKNQISWSVDNLVRAFRELFSHLNWQKVFEALSEIPDEISLDAKAFATFLQITNKSKPQNLPYPLNLILQTQWASPLLQISFIENSIQFYVEKKEKTIHFGKAGERRQEIIDDLSGVKEKVTSEFLHVWLSVDLVERLLVLSNSLYFQRVRQIFEAPLKQVPEYLLLTLSQCKPQRNTLLNDELLSLLMPQFLGNHINSIIVLQALWRNNQALMIRAICELCRHDQRIMNLSRVLDITQEVKESLMPIVDCEDYYFAVNLAILAGKRDFLHYDVWLQRRIADVGTPFIRALLKYVREHILKPLAALPAELSQQQPPQPTSTKKGSSQQQQQQMMQEGDSIEHQKVIILEKSHLSKEKLAMTIENLSNLQNQHNPLIKEETRAQIKKVVEKLAEHFPNQFGSTQNSEEIDTEANNYFQRVFSAEAGDVDQKITELIETMQRFRSSEVKKEQEIYACMLHSLFDEYRFLHKYPGQYLEKIAKLFGAIIKYRIMDPNLTEIAMKFVVEACRRDGKRMRFGVIVIKQILEMLPQFPPFFDSIYEQRNQIQTQEPALVRDIEELYERTMARSARTRVASSVEDATSRQDVGESYSQRQSFSSDDSMTSFNNAKEPQLKFVPKQESKAAAKGDQTGTQQVANAGENDTQQPINVKGQKETAPAPTTTTAPQTNAPAKKGPQAGKNQDKKANSGFQASVQVPDFRPQTYVKKHDNAEALHHQLNAQDPSIAQAAHGGSGIKNVVDQVHNNYLQQALSAQAASGTTPGLNPSSVAFRKPDKQPQIAPVAGLPPAHSPYGPPSQPQPPISQYIPAPSNSAGPSAVVFPSVRTFKPTPSRSPAPQPQQVSHHYTQIQQQMEQKLKKAIKENVRVKLEDVIEDNTMPAPPQDQQEEIRGICNTIGRGGNFGQKMDQLKAIIAPNPLANLNWFIQFILLKRLTSTTSLNSIFIDMIKQAGHKDSVSFTVQQAVELFKRCFLIDEDSLNQAAQKPPANASLVKQYLVNLATFIGQMTLASNRPLYQKEVDLKQLLVEGWESEKRKLVVTFVCRIMKGCANSLVFKSQNPWVKANLEVLKEILDLSGMNTVNNPHSDIIMEIEGLFKSFNTNGLDVQGQGFLKGWLTRHHMGGGGSSQAQKTEIQHLISRQRILPTVSVPPPTQPLDNYPGRGPSPSPQLAWNQQQQVVQQQQQQQQQYIDMNKVFQKAVISSELLQLLGLAQNTLTPQQDQLLRKIVAESVGPSITEILPPVVDRSVTIALITTKELVLKDFAFDPSAEKVLKAAELIVHNLAGSLALVTCREPLKMQLAANLKKWFLVPGNQSILTGEDRVHASEPLAHELAQLASKDNLELGCKLIKKAVIERALSKVKEDITIKRLVDVRNSAKSAEAFKNAVLQDEAQVAQFADLPQQLKPNQNGLTDAQFQVYQDFQRFQTSVSTMQNADSQTLKASGEALDPSDEIEAFLKVFEGLQVFERKFEQILAQKISSMNEKPSESIEQGKKLAKFCENIFLSVCERLASQPHSNYAQSSDKTIKILDFLSFVTANLKLGEDLQGRLTSTFLSRDASIVHNAPLNLELMRRGLIATSKWDSSIATYIRESQQFSSSLSTGASEVYNFLNDFFNIAIINSNPNSKDALTYANFPNIMALILKLSEQDPSMAQYFSALIQDYRHRTTWTKESLKEYFQEWAVISFEEVGNAKKQEQEVNRFFNTLKQLGLYKDHNAVQKFCKTMLELSVERALFQSDGVTKRPADRLVYRYIESFLNLLVVSLMNFTSGGDGMNKHDFLASVFDAIFEVMEEDHTMRKGDFNQKPYYRILINILRVISNPQTFNTRSQTQVLLSIADLFIRLSPRDFPAFSFAWLELISHKLFMSNFLLAQQGNPQQQVATQNAQRKPTAAGAQPQLGAMADSGSGQKWWKFKDIVLVLFTFLKSNMVVGQPMTEPLAKFYEATLRIVLVIKHDCPEFLCDFHFHFVNNLPDHCIQLRNIITSAQPRNTPVVDPFSRSLKVDQLPEIHQLPRTQSNYENYLVMLNLREDLERHFRDKNNKSIIQDIADKLRQSEEVVNGRKRVNSGIFSALALFVHNYAHTARNRQIEKECYDMFKTLVVLLDSEARVCLLNSFVNELRYVNATTYFFSYLVITMFNEVDETIQEQISRILIERLQTHGPHPWGLCITFRELLQNPKYSFAKKGFIVRNQAEIEMLFQTKLQSFHQCWMAPQRQQQ